VGVWQVREGIRSAMKQTPIIAGNFEDAITIAAKKTSISKTDWYLKGNLMKLMHQKTITDFF